MYDTSKKLSEDQILDCTKTYKEIFGLSEVSSTDEVNAFNLRRINNFIASAYPEKIKSNSIDLATLLIVLASRGCEITIPKYESTKVSKVRDNEIIVDSVRHGKIISLRSNQITFNFSVTIEDKSYHEKKVDGTFIDFCPRTYTITDEYGNFHNNWNNFKFDMTEKEKEFFQNVLDGGNLFEISCFVNSQLAQAFYSEYYKNIKLLIERLSAERKYLMDVKKRFLPKCNLRKKISELTDEHYAENNSAKVIKESAEQFESVIVKCFEAKISNCPEFKFSYIDEKSDPNEIVKRCENILDGIVGISDKYRFHARMIELAFVNVNPFKEDRKPNDFQTYNRCNCKWNEQTVKLPRCRIEWYELMFKDYSILCRYYNKSIKQKIK